jgi:hypothetical protein
MRAIIHQYRGNFSSKTVESTEFSKITSADSPAAIEQNLQVEMRLYIRFNDQIHSISNRILCSLSYTRTELEFRDVIKEGVIDSPAAGTRAMAEICSTFRDIKQCIAWPRTSTGATTFLILRSSQSEKPTSSAL